MEFPDWVQDKEKTLYELCFLSEERLFSSVIHVDLNKTILAAFITRLIRHPEKTNPNGKTTMYCSPDYSKLFEAPCIAEFFTGILEPWRPWTLAPARG